MAPPFLLLGMDFLVAPQEPLAPFCLCLLCLCSTPPQIPSLLSCDYFVLDYSLHVAVSIHEPRAVSNRSMFPVSSSLAMPWRQ